MSSLRAHSDSTRGTGSDQTNTTTSSSSIITDILSCIQNENYPQLLTLTTKLLVPDSSTPQETINLFLASVGTVPDHHTHTSSTYLAKYLQQSIEQIHVRTLLSLQKYTKVIEYYASSPENNTIFIEYLYALYKLGRYVKCCDAIRKRIQKQTDNSNKYDITCMMHILAQCQYKLHETQDALDTYNKLLLHHDDQYYMDEILTNVLAVKVSNITTVGKISQTSSSSSIIEERILERLQQMDIGGYDKQNEDNDYDDDDVLYELLYNAGTELLIQSTSLTQTKDALDMLRIAEQKCRDEYETIKEDDDEVNQDNDQEEHNHNIMQKALGRDIMPIQTNIALAKMQLGDTNSSTRSYLELVVALKKLKESDSSFDGGGALIAIENNLAVLQSKRTTSSSSASVFDLIKKIPDVTSMDNNTSAAAGGGNTMSNNQKVTPYQLRTILYNRAVLYHKLNKLPECKAVLNLLKKSLSSTSNSKNKDASSQQVPTNNGSKKKRKSGSSQVMFAPTLTHAESILWEARIAVLETEYTHVSTGAEEGKDGTTVLDDFIAIEDKIKSELNHGRESNYINDVYILEYALAEILLYKLQKSLQIANSNNNDDPTLNEEKQRSLATTLEQLPASIRQRPAVIATLYSIYSKLGLNDKVKFTLDESTMNDERNHDSLADKKRLGDFKLRLGLYEEAATMYKSVLEELENENDGLDDQERMECIAGLVKALSHFDIEAAFEYAEQLVVYEQDDFDGEELEAMEIPRLSKGVTGSNKMRKLLERHRNSDQRKNKKKNQDSILRRRAKKREAYLEKLKEEGKYNPDRPVKPDPERWIPKSQRSYSKRGRRARSQWVGAQGIGSGAGADKDAAKLDAAARAAAKAQGADLSNQSRSTAHLAVSSDGKGGRRR